MRAVKEPWTAKPSKRPAVESQPGEPSIHSVGRRQSNHRLSSPVIAGQGDLETLFERLLARAEQIRSQRQRQRGWKLYSFHRGRMHRRGCKASAPYDFGLKTSIVTTMPALPDGQFVVHAKALPGNPDDRHTLSGVIDATEKLTGCAIERAYLDKGYFLTGDEVNRTAPLPGCRTSTAATTRSRRSSEYGRRIACWLQSSQHLESEPT